MCGFYIDRDIMGWKYSGKKCIWAEHVAFYVIISQTIWYNSYLHNIYIVLGNISSL